MMSARAYATPATAPAKKYQPKVPKHFSYQDKRQKMSERKTYLYNMYVRVMQESELVVLFEAENVSVPLLKNLRTQMHSIKLPDGDKARLSAKNGGEEWDMPVSTLSMARTGLLRPVCREDKSKAVQGLGPYLHGQVALLSFPVLSPEYVGKVLRAMDKIMSAAIDEVDPKSGKKPPKMKAVVAVAERSRLLDAKAIPAFTKLPNLPTLHAQVVGLLSAPSQQLVGLLSQAGGATLAATLEARRRDLEKASE
ncbi:hypothetical protein Malapachy_4045 [Malassezia pachydermatis]|uniref:50S ribosomal protein L10 n=1 Tax=Malassezia pachydermatis TaxID=77020 RepID=A0A0M9VPF6_9BASI|nr:hypothetical protein Malapachy_4045 [Malassezia pachydermatis]KOS14205.1 hypothetical protein Malapachy_4045 [Malassezia pachydermatis]